MSGTAFTSFNSISSISILSGLGYKYSTTIRESNMKEIGSQ